jgi:hypothetical protein
MLVYTDHLTPSAGAEHFKVLLADLKKAPIVFSVRLLRPGWAIHILSYHDVGSKDLCLRRLAAVNLD